MVYFGRYFDSKIDKILWLNKVRKGENQLLLKFLAVMIEWIDYHKPR